MSQSYKKLINFRKFYAIYTQCEIMSRISLTEVRDFFTAFLRKSGIHGFSYVGNSFLHLIERLLWMLLIGGALYYCIIFSLGSWHRYLYDSTVVSIERDHYYWNTSLPALTICPMNRLNQTKVDAYAK